MLNHLYWSLYRYWYHADASHKCFNLTRGKFELYNFKIYSGHKRLNLLLDMLMKFPKMLKRRKQKAQTTTLWVYLLISSKHGQ